MIETSNSPRPERKRRGRGKNYWLFEASPGVWGLDYRTPEGRRVRKIVGSYDDAKTERARIETAKKSGTFVDENRAPTFQEYSEHYLTTLSSKKASYEREKRLMKNLQNFFGTSKVSKITRVKVREFRELRSKQVSGATCNREMALLRHLFNVAAEDGKIVQNPARAGSGLKAFKETPRERFLEMPEIKKLTDAIQARIVKNEHQGNAKKYWQYLQTAVTIALHTGMRKSEILTLRWTQINWERHNIFLPKTKNGASRPVPLDTITRHQLTEHKVRVKKNGEELVFPSFDAEGNIVPVSDVKTAFQQALKDAGITGFRFHDLRHTFASHYMMNVGDLYKLSKILGHKDIKMTMRYAQHSPDFILAERERLDTFWTVAAKTSQEQPHTVSSNLIQ